MAVSRTSSMQLYVKWHEYNDSENSWISWRDNNELAAVDTYLSNNPEIVVPIFTKKKRPVLRKKLVTHVKQTSTLQSKDVSTNETYTINYLPPKCLSASEEAFADSYRAMSFGAFRKVPAGVPRIYNDIDNVPNSEKMGRSDFR